MYYSFIIGVCILIQNDTFAIRNFLTRFGHCVFHGWFSPMFSDVYIRKWSAQVSQPCFGGLCLFGLQVWEWEMVLAPFWITWRGFSHLHTPVHHSISTAIWWVMTLHPVSTTLIVYLLSHPLELLQLVLVTLCSTDRTWWHSELYVLHLVFDLDPVIELGLSRPCVDAGHGRWGTAL